MNDHNKYTYHFGKNSIGKGNEVISHGNIEDVESALEVVVNMYHAMIP